MGKMELLILTMILWRKAPEETVAGQAKNPKGNDGHEDNSPFPIPKKR